jgi:DNA-directed RNA polymerase I subunit RPA1
MQETLKEIKRAAETDLTAHKNPETQEQLKKAKNAAAKATRASKKQQDSDGEADEIDPQEQSKPDDSDSDDKHSSEDQVMDIDGLQKAKVTSYGNSDSEHEPSEDVEMASAAPDTQEQVSNINREKHSKYLQYLRGDFEFDKHKSATVTLQFPLEDKKLLLLSLAQNVIKKLVVRSVPGIDRCSLISPEKGDPHLIVAG